MWKKDLLLLIISVDTAVVGSWGPMISPGFAQMAEDWHMSYNALNGGLGWAIFAIGISCFITNGLSVKYGRRPVIILGNLILFISSVWGYFAHSYHSLLASRIFGAIGMSPFEVLTTAIIGDIYFVHERGLRLAFWGLCLSIGVGGGSCISGYIIEDIGWNWTYGICACLYGAFIILIFFFVPETVYKRDPAYNLDLGTTDHTFETLEATERKGEHMEHLETTKTGSKVAHREVLYTGAEEKPYTFWEELRPWRGAESDENLLVIIVRPFGMLLFPQVLYGFITYGLSTSWLVVMISVLAQLFTGPPYNFSVSDVGLISIAALVASLLGFVAGPMNDWTVKKLARWNGGIYEPVRLSSPFTHPTLPWECTDSDIILGIPTCPQLPYPHPRCGWFLRLWRDAAKRGSLGWTCGSLWHHLLLHVIPQHRHLRLHHRVPQEQSA
jgi:MFS family permease